MRGGARPSSMESMAEADTAHIVIAGGGVAGLEACLALRSFLGEAELGIDLLCREHRFEYRPLTVLEPFDGGPAWSMELERFAADQDVRLVRDALAAVEPDRHVAITAYSGRLSYDALLVCIGARPVRTLPGAITFRGGRDAAAVRAALDALQPGDHGHDRVRGALRRLLDAAALRAGDPGRRAAAGPRFTGADRDDLARGGAAGGLRRGRLDGGGAAPRRPRDRVHRRCPRHGGGRRRARAPRRPPYPGQGRHHLPDLVGRQVPGLRQDAQGFVAVDDHGRVAGADGVYAAGDITTFPLKQGGLATQQADAAAETMLAGLGVPIVPRPFEPVLQGVLYTEGAPVYLRSTENGQESPPRAYSMWWPPSKIAGRHLAPYLATRAGAPRAPEVRPEREGIPVSIDVPRLVHGVSNALDPSAVPPG